MMSKSQPPVATPGTKQTTFVSCCIYVDADNPPAGVTATALVRMCGNGVSPVQAQALIAANFAHDALIYRKAA